MPPVVKINAIKTIVKQLTNNNGCIIFTLSIFQRWKIMGIFYCTYCGKWHNLENSHNVLVRRATMIDPEEYSDELYCDDCGTIIDESNIIDDPIELLNKKEVRP